MRGAADRSYGINVARLANLDRHLLHRAAAIAADLEKQARYRRYSTQFVKRFQLTICCKVSHENIWIAEKSDNPLWECGVSEKFATAWFIMNLRPRGRITAPRELRFKWLDSQFDKEMCTQVAVNVMTLIWE